MKLKGLKSPTELKNASINNPHLYCSITCSGKDFMCVCVCVCENTTTPTIAGRGKIGEKHQSNSYHLICTEILFLLSVSALKVNSMNSLASGH